MKTKNLGKTIQQYRANLPWHSNANITWLLVIGLKNSGIIWWLSSWISYLTEVQHTSADIWLRQMPFWKQKSTIWLTPVAEDFLCAPASQAYVERIFSA